MACLSIARDEEIDKGRPQGSREGRVEGKGVNAGRAGVVAVGGAGGGGSGGSGGVLECTLAYLFTAVSHAETSSARLWRGGGGGMGWWG